MKTLPFQTDKYFMNHSTNGLRPPYAGATLVSFDLLATAGSVISPTQIFHMMVTVDRMELKQMTLEHIMTYTDRDLKQVSPDY
jgi:hypothetical protein